MKILKINTPFIISPLNFICNKALSTGILPSHLKYPVVKPLYKKGDKKDMANNTQISLLPSFSKVLEKVLFNRLVAHFNKSNIIVSEKFGFRSNSSTKKATFGLIYERLEVLNKQKTCGEYIL
jgi:hypothetical protein